MLERFHASEDAYGRLTSEIISYAVGAHHGLFDCIGKMSESGFSYRLQKTGIGYEQAVSAFFSDVNDLDIDCLFSKAKSEIRNIVETLDRLFPSDPDFAFATGMLERLVLSALMNGDRQDTAEFMNNAVFPQWPEDMRLIWDTRLTQMEHKLSALPSDSPISDARKTISDKCSAAAELPCGIYRLNVPTGGGKTLASLRYALTHAKKWNKKRILFTSPLLSILEQNAAVIREFLAADSLILEHHSNLVQEGPTQDELDNRELAVQTWNAPVVITTMVQLLNTLFDGKNSSIRRFHSLCDSIIIIDEVQTVPTKMLTLFNLTMEFLNAVCGATIVLCSATQPYFEKANHPMHTVIQDLVPYDVSLWHVFQRTEICPLPPMREEELPSLIHDLVNSADSLLVICNKRREAERLYRLSAAEDFAVFHLSAAMCIQHRRDTIKALKAALCSGKKTLCISTQIIEAGVDISFQRVLRFAAGMDSVVQAAGRCNRNGESTQRQPVYLVNVSDETLGRLPDIRRGKAATIALQASFEQKPNHFANDLASDIAIRFFYEKLYSDMDEGSQDYPLPDLKTSVFDLLSANTKYSDADVAECEEYMLTQAFKTAGQKFEVFNEQTRDVIVPYGYGRELIVSLCSARAVEDPVYRAELLKAVRPYSVSVYEPSMQSLLRSQAIYPVCDNYAFALSEQYYDNALGLIEEMTTQSFLEV